MKRKPILLGVLLGVIGVRVTTEAVAAGAEPVRVPLTVDAANVPQPALRYELFQDVYDQVPGNAAIAYSRAISMILQDERWKKDADQCGKWLGQPLDQLPEQEVAAMLAEYAIALRELMKATLYEQCDWEVPIRREGMATLLPHLSKVRSAARLLALDTRLCIRQGRFDDAVARLRAGLTLARHTGDSTLIEGLVGVAVTQQMLGLVEDFIQQPGAPNLYWALTDLPPAFLSAWQSTRWERSCIYVEFPVLRDVGNKPITAADLRRTLIGFHNLGENMPATTNPSSEDQAALSVAGMGWLVYPLARQGLVREGMTPERLNSLSAAEILVRYVGDGYVRQRDNMFKWFALPYPEAKKGLARAQTEFEEAIARDPIENMFARMFLPALSRAVDRFAELERQFAVLRCIEAVRCYAAEHERQLPASLDLIEGMPVPSDPVTGLPFRYHVEGATATLEPPPAASVRKPKIYEITLRP